MGFLKGMKAKLEDTKQGLSDMNDRRKISNLISNLSSYPLCSENDAYQIVESGLTKYLGRYHIALIDFETASNDEITQELAELDLVVEKEREFLKTVFSDENIEHIFQLKGSICVSFFSRVLTFLEDTEMVISQEIYERILSAMVEEASGFDVYLHLTADGEVDLYDSHREFKNLFLSNVFFPELEGLAQKKYANYTKVRQTQEEVGDNSIATALSTDHIDIGQTIDLYNYEDNSWSKGLVGAASVTRMVEYYLPNRILRNQVIASIYNLNGEMSVTGNVHWHFCEDGILQVELNQYSQPRWISKKNIKALTFGEGYNGLSTNGATEFEHFYLYMTVETVTGDEFTLFRFLNDNRKNAERNLKVYLNQTLPKLADHYPIYFSDNVYDISKHYKTTYTTTYVWGEF